MAAKSQFWCIDFPEGLNKEDLNEFRELVISAGADPVALVTAKRPKPDAKTFIGKGKVEIAAALRLHGAQLVIFNHALTPSQERNLEKILEARAGSHGLDFGYFCAARAPRR